MIHPGDTLADLVVIACGEPWRSSMGDLRQSFGARDTAGQTYSGTVFLSTGRTILHPTTH